MREEIDVSRIILISVEPAVGVSKETLIERLLDSPRTRVLGLFVLRMLSGSSASASTLKIENLAEVYVT